jgi:small subunit ribosomal protein S1
VASDEKGFAALMDELDAGAPARGPRVGDEVTGTIAALDPTTVFVDVGVKAEAILERSEIDETKSPVAVGDKVTAFVVSKKGGQISLRTNLARGGDAAALKQAHETGMPVIGKVSAVNKGGLEVEIGGVRAFCPMSQIDIIRIEEPAVFVGQELECLVTKFEEEGGGRSNVVVSRRALIERQRKILAAETLATLSVGSTVRGKITRIMDFGAFVELGGIEGLLHKSELGFGRVDDPNEVLSVGDIVDALVKRIEPSKEPGRPDRISLSLKALMKDPWDEIVASLPKGSKRSGKVVRLEPFGAFVALADGLEGLVHISEIIDGRRLNHPREAVSVGQEIEVVVLEIDNERKRVALSMKQVATHQEAAQASGYKPAAQSLGTFADLFNKKKHR